MSSDLSKLALPAALVVTTFCLTTGCSDDSSTDADDVADISDEGTDFTYCADIVDEAECEAEPGCGLDPDAPNEGCVNICYMVVDEAECEAIERCEWNAEAGTETGGGGACMQVFT